MDVNRATQPSYQSSRPLANSDTSATPKGKVGHDVRNLWSKYISKGPLFDFRQFEQSLRDIKLQGNDTSYVDKVRDIFMEELSKVKSFARKFSTKILDKVGKMNITDGQILEYVNQQGKKKQLSDYSIEAIFRDVAQILSESPTRTPFFRFNPYNSSKISKSLGYLGADSYDHFGNQKHPAIERIDKLNKENSTTHSNVITQALHYQDCGVEAVTGAWDPLKFDKFMHIHPVVAALYVPKIRLLDKLTLFSSISNIVLCRSRNEPITTRPDYELFYNMVHDRNESVCDHKDPLNDLALRAKIQTDLWKAVLCLRAGRYYDHAGMKLLKSLNNCRYYRYDAADIAYSGDEGDITRRLLMTFSLRPIKIRTLPFFTTTSSC